MPAEITLSPCPFCGSTDIDTSCENAIECSECHAQFIDVDDLYGSWNRRADTVECANLQTHNTGSPKLCRSCFHLFGDCKGTASDGVSACSKYSAQLRAGA
jgi:hypothetical protein